MKKHVLAGGAAAVLALTSIGTGLASAVTQANPLPGTEGCTVVTFENGQTCSYTPTVPGGAIFTPSGDAITITYIVHNADGTTSTVKTSLIPSSSQENCVLWTPASSGARYVNVTNVSVTATSLNSVDVIGQPYPPQSPEQLGPAC